MEDPGLGNLEAGDIGSSKETDTCHWRSQLLRI